jgi:hypothetical protein
METSPIINKIDKRIMAFVNQMTEPYKDGDDIIMLYEILNGKRFPEGNVLLKYKVGSKRRFNYDMFDERKATLFYNEFIVQIRLTATSFHFMATMFHHKNNQTEGFSYNIDSKIDSGVPDETWVLPEGDRIDNQTEIDGRKPEIFLEEICQLHKLDREMTTSCEMEPSEEVYEIKKRFDDLMESVTNEQINWITSNELEPDEKITILQNLSTERKLNILENFENENIN